MSGSGIDTKDLGNTLKYICSMEKGSDQKALANVLFSHPRVSEIEDDDVRAAWQCLLGGALETPACAEEFEMLKGIFLSIPHARRCLSVDYSACSFLRAYDFSKRAGVVGAEGAQEFMRLMYGDFNSSFFSKFNFLLDVYKKRFTRASPTSFEDLVRDPQIFGGLTSVDLEYLCGDFAFVTEGFHCFPLLLKHPEANEKVFRACFCPGISHRSEGEWSHKLIFLINAAAENKDNDLLTKLKGYMEADIFYPYSELKGYHDAALLLGEILKSKVRVRPVNPHALGAAMLSLPATSTVVRGFSAGGSASSSVSATRAAMSTRTGEEDTREGKCVVQ